MKTIGMIVPTMDNTFFANLVHDVTKEMNDKGYVVIASDSQNDAKKEMDAMKELVKASAEGILCVSGLSNLPEDILPENYPLVWLDRRPKSTRKVAWVANDDAHAMMEATQLLVDKGCRNIVLLPGYLAQHQENYRVQGYKEGLARNQLSFLEDSILYRSGKDTSESETEALVIDLLHQDKKVDGIITSSDRAAFGAIKALGKVGYYVPEDVRLISFDNSPYTMMASPSITSIDRNPYLLAKKACEILLNQIEGKEFEICNVVDVSLVERDSTR